MIKSLTDAQYSIFMTRLAETHIRDCCLLLFLLHGGLRNGEVCNLNWSDISVNDEIFHTINVINGHSRLKTFRYVTLTPKLIESLVSYTSWCKNASIDRSPVRPVFTTRNLGIRMQQRDLQRIVSKYSKLWLQTSFTPHSLRHTFATRLLRCSNVRVVQQLLGHTSITSTQVYTHPNSDDRNNAIQKAF